MKRLFTILFTLILLLALIVSCAPKTSVKAIEEPPEEKTVIEESPNDSPVADAGEDIRCTTGNEITLDGSNSSDPNGDKLSYIWSMDGEEFSGETLSFEVTKPGTYFVTLTVFDGKASDSDMLQINVEEKVEVVEEVIKEEPVEENVKEKLITDIEILSLTSPVERGAKASISIKTNPNMLCTITVYYKSGASKAQGLDPKNSDGNGNCSWTWKVGTRTTPGDWRIVIKVQNIGQIEQYFTVTG